VPRYATMTKQTVDNGAGMTRVLWCLATSDKPLTKRELAEKMGVDKKQVNITEMYKRGFVVRRRRLTDSMGPNPYEYTVRPQGGVEE